MVKIIADILFEEELDKYLDDAYEQAYCLEEPS